MPALKQVNRSRRVRLGNGKVVPLRARVEAPAAVYFGVAFKDGATVFMPRRAGMPDRDLGELRAHALAVRGLGAEHEADIVATAQACNNCARSIPGCTGCAFHDAVKKAGEV